MSSPEPVVCPSCGTNTGAPFFNLESVPVFCNVLYDTAEAARNAATGHIRLVHCDHCGLVFNRDFDPRLVEYSPAYENALHFSERFRQFAKELASHLVQTYELCDRGVAEIGCGDGDFLETLIRHGVSRGIGFDPSAPNECRATKDRPLEIRRELFGHQPIPPDVAAVVCRHVLEHIDQPQSWLQAIAKGMGNNRPLFYCEVPNGQWLLETFNFWDVIYEHITYWTPTSLERLFRGAGFEVIRTTPCFENQFLGLEARQLDDVECDEVPAHEEFDTARYCEDFAAEVAARTSRWAAMLRGIAAEGKNAVVWGAGSKGVTFVNVLADQMAAIRGVVDVNPRKQGKFLPGTGLPVLPPEALVDMKPHAVFVMNSNYRDEIQGMLSQLGIFPDFHTVMEPTPTEENRT